MGKEVKLSHIGDTLESYDYPIAREEAIEQGSSTTILLADGRQNLGEVIASSEMERFASPEELSTEVMSHLPIEAVGEPNQSEGDA